MKKNKKREVVYAKLQGTDAFIPGLGGLGNTLPPTMKALKLKMYEVGDRLLIEVNGKKAFIPLTNVQVGVYAADVTFDEVEEDERPKK